MPSTIASERNGNVPVVLSGAGTRWDQKVARRKTQVLDNDHLWEILFVSGGYETAVRPIVFGGQSGTNPLGLWEFLLNKQREADDLARSSPSIGALLPRDRCVLCRHQFGTKYEDPFFGTIELRRNRLNRYYCNQCDYFIRICPGQAPLVMPVLVVDVRDSRGIRNRVGDLRAYSQLLLRFQQRVAAEVQRNLGLVLNTIGDAVLAAWPSGFTPLAMRDRLGWDDRHPARIPAMCAIEAAHALARIAPSEFDGVNLPFRGAVETTEMVIFAVTASDPEQAKDFQVLPEDEVGDPLPGADVSEIPTGPCAIDIAGEAVEVASGLASHTEALPGHMYISQRTDVEATIDTSALEYAPRGESGVMTRAT